MRIIRIIMWTSNSTQPPPRRWPIVNMQSSNKSPSTSASAPLINSTADPGLEIQSNARTLDSTSLLGREGVVDILHNNERYTLRRTKQGKLILSK
jgi:hemin uptake protein HemP